MTVVLPPFQRSPICRMVPPMDAVLRLVLLARPRGAVLVCLLPVLGFGYGHWERGSQVSPLAVAPIILAIITVWLLGHAGAMWLNAELDRDEGAVLLGRAVRVPRGTGRLGYGALAASVALAAAWLDAIALACVIGCALLAMLYSHPRIALKGHPLGGPLVNGVGYASLSPIAGWSLAQPIFTWRAPLTLLGLVLGVLGLYFAAQAFQRDEDAARGYRTLVVTHGPRVTLQVARACLSFAMWGLALGALAGIYPRAVLIATPLVVVVDRFMARWTSAPGGGDGRWALGMVKRLVLALVVVVATVYATHFAQILAGDPCGGLGTAIVPGALR